MDTSRERIHAPHHVIDAELAAIIARGAANGISALIEVDDDGALFLSDFARDRADPASRGQGAVMLREVCALADRLGLVFETSHMTDEPGLSTYYGRFGLVPDGEPGLVTNLRRMPATVNAA